MPVAPGALSSISYGLYVLTANDGNRDCGCIVNSVMQLTVDPLRIAVSVAKKNYTSGVIVESRKFNISILSETATMDIIRRFGMQSGRDVAKFEGFDAPVSENGLRYLDKSCCALVSGEVEQVLDCGSHLLFIAAVTQCEYVTDEPPMTYAYYHANVKPKPQPKKEKRGYICKVCGYFHEGEELPEGFECPICKHGASDFEPVGF